MKIGVLGAGSMGIGIAQIAASFGHQVILCDNSAAALDHSMAKLTKIMNRLVQKQRITEPQAQQLLDNNQTTSMLSEFNDCGLVVEAIIENLEIKQTVF